MHPNSNPNPNPKLTLILTLTLTPTLPLPLPLPLPYPGAPVRGTRHKVSEISSSRHAYSAMPTLALRCMAILATYRYCLLLTRWKESAKDALDTLVLGAAQGSGWIAQLDTYTQVYVCRRRRRCRCVGVGVCYTTPHIVWYSMCSIAHAHTYTPTPTPTPTPPHSSTTRRSTRPSSGPRPRCGTRRARSSR